MQQGDPLASLVFSLVLQPIIDTLEERVPGLKVNAWYLDDGTLVGTLDQLQEVVDILMEKGPRRGLILSTAATVAAGDRPKTTVWSPQASLTEEADPLNRGVEKVEEEGIILLGAPVGSQEFVEAKVKQKVEKVEEITGLLPLLEDPHTEFVLLRSCLALPKLSFVLRTTNTTVHNLHLQEFDRVTREGLTRILGSPVDARTWHQAKLPVAMGGMGLRGAEDHAPAAYAASVLAAQPLTQALLGTGPDDQPSHTLSPEFLATMSTKVGEEVTEEELVGVTQKQLSVRVDLYQQKLLLERIGEDEVRERARLASLALPHAGDWLNTPPLVALGLHLRPREFVLVARYRLGLQLYGRAGPCPSCLRPNDTMGDHAMSCGVGGERISRHNHLRDALFDTAVAACSRSGPNQGGQIPPPR